MKTKKLSKKLELNKKTLVNLNNPQMDHLKGGLTGPIGGTCACTDGAPACTLYDSNVYCYHTSNYPGLCNTEGNCV